MTKLSQKLYENDTICAISTAFGVGAIAIVRLSGSKAIDICSKVFVPNNKSVHIIKVSSHSLHFGKVMDNEAMLDEVIVGVFRNPHSYTGEDIVEISCHGSVYIQKQLIQLLIRHGARAARPGEFTLRAFLNGKMDLSQAEAVAELIAGDSEAAHKLAIQQMKGGFSRQIKQLRDKLTEFSALLELELDFSEEDVEFANREKMRALLIEIEKEVNSLLQSYSLGNVLKTGIPVAIAGKPNVGKSTLLNVLLNEDRALVSHIPGTTRDAIEDTMTLNGVCFRFIDTAGLRESNDTIEIMGVERSYQKIQQASIIIYMFDINESEFDNILESIEQFRATVNGEDKKIIFVANKIDQLISFPHELRELTELNTIFISAKRKENIHLVTERLLQLVSENFANINGNIVTNSRHYDALMKAGEALKDGLNALDKGISNDLLATHIHVALHYLGEITGDITTEDILETIFEKFCIGK